MSQSPTTEVRGLSAQFSRNWKKTSEELPKHRKRIIFKSSKNIMCLGYYDSEFNEFVELYQRSYDVDKIPSWCYVPEYDL